MLLNTICRRTQLRPLATIIRADRSLVSIPLQLPILHRSLSTSLVRRTEITSGPCRQLVIKNIPPGVNEAAIHDTLTPFGPLQSLRILAHGVALVTFSEQESADAAASAKLRLWECNLHVQYDQQTIPGNPPSRRLFVLSIPWEATEDAVRDVFSQFGPLESLHLPASDKENHQGKAMVTFLEQAAATAAVHADLQLLHRKLHVHYAAPLLRKNRYISGWPASHRLIVRSIPHTATETDVRVTLSHFGPLKSLSLAVDRDETNTGIAYATFAREEDAASAFDQRHSISLFENKLSFEYPAPPPAPKTPRTRLLSVYNLDPHTTEAEIRERFAPFGPIRSIRLGKAEYAHVYFERLEDAVAACERFPEELRSLHGRDIQVGYREHATPTRCLRFYDFSGGRAALEAALGAFKTDVRRIHFLRATAPGKASGSGLLFFPSIERATAALSALGGAPTPRGPLYLDYAPPVWA
ncbi:hypothetical protein C8R43DRAFT_991728 [Mycena crocata]|nr:hypothetical protein C8R43DRAFT_991728 [Mycena crocata]